jgi:C4-dicarboxylate transporter, DctM subunit
LSNSAIGLYGVIALFVLLGLRMPIAVALSLVSVVGVWAIRGLNPALGSMATLPYDFSANWTLSAVPMFLLMGAFAFNSGMTASVYKLSRMWLWWLPGSLAIATNWASALFGAISGSSIAVTAMMARLAVPEMLKYKYDKALATSVVAASGTIDAMIPPSIPFIIYAWYAEVPVGELFMAGVVPGILTGLIYMTMIIIRCWRNPDLAPPIDRDFSKQERRQVTLDAWPLPLLFLGIFGGLYTGIATPTEAAAASAALALVIAVVRREMSWSTLWNSLVESCTTTSSIFLIVIGAAFFTRFMAVSGFPDYLSGAIRDLAPTPMMFILLVGVVIIIMGMFLDGVGIMLLLLPIVVPIARSFQVDLIWLGVIIVKLIMIGLLHPPIGIQAFIVKGVVGEKVSLMTIYRGLCWFLAAEAVIMFLIISFPQITLFLPYSLLR